MPAKIGASNELSVYLLELDKSRGNEGVGSCVGIAETKTLPGVCSFISPIYFLSKNIYSIFYVKG